MWRCVLTAGMAVWLASAAAADERERGTADRETGRAGVKRVLLLGQSPDDHAFGTHEYMAGVHILAQLLHAEQNLQTIIVKADHPWTAGPELLDGADAAVVFLSEGAKWLSQDEARLAAFRRLAERGGGLVVLHWGMGTREAEPIGNFVELFGACHGGPDRKHKVLTTTLKPAAEGHPILAGIEALDIRDEFYYQLKRVRSAGNPQESPLTPLLTITADGQTEMVAWAWERPDGGRSFGFSGLHFDDNWQLKEYPRLISRGVLWTMKLLGD
jgi:type 1 glutamine amidotransferase